MKKIMAIVFGLLLTIPAIAQDNTELTEFSGGNIAFDMTMYSGIMYGIGSRNLASNSTMTGPGVESLYWNPAALGFMETGQFHVDYAPPVYFQPDRFYDFQTKLNSSIDKEFRPQHVAGTPYKHPELNTEFNSGTRLHSFGLAVPYKDFAFAAAWANPFELEMNFLVTGFSAFMRQDGATASEDIAFRFSGAVNGNLNLFADQFSLGFAYRPTEKFSAGFTLERYSSTAKLVSDVNFYGSLSIGGGEPELFNDATKGYNNSLFTIARGKMEGSGWGMRYGFAFRPDNKSDITLSGNLPVEITLNGKLSIENNTPAFYAGGTIDPDRIDPVQTTRSNRVVYTSERMVMRLPGSLNIGYSRNFNWALFTANFGFGFNELSVTYGNSEQVEDNEPVYREYTQGMSPGFDFRIGADFGLLKILGGAIFADEVKKGYPDNTTTSMVVPLFALGLGGAIDEHVRIDSYIIAVASPFSRLSLSYNF